MLRLARRSCPCRRPLACLGPAIALAFVLGHAPPVAAQQGPIQLFPGLEPSPAAREPAVAQPPRQPSPPSGEQAAPPAASGAPATVREPPPDVRVEGLAAPNLDSIGLALSAGGFDQNLWRGADAALVLQLLADLPVVTTNPSLRDLTRRLLVSGAPLAGAEPVGRLLGLRLDRLLAMGDLETAKRLIDRLPPGGVDEALARRAAEVALLLGDDEAACSRAGAVAPDNGAAFWAEVTIYCRLASGDEGGARLAIDLLRDSGAGGDPTSLRLATMIADGAARGTPAGLDQPTAVQVALLRLAKLPLPAAALETAAPAVLSAAARTPSLSGRQQLAVAERAFQTGGLSATGLDAVYREVPYDGSQDVVAKVRDDWGPKSRALAYLAALDLEDAPRQRAEILAATWLTADGAERLLVAEMFAKPFTELPVHGDLITVAPSAARALLAADRPVPAARWFSLLTAEANADRRARRELAGVLPLFALAGVGGSEPLPAMDAQRLSDWRASVRSGDRQEERLVAMLAGAGAALGADAGRAALVAPYLREAVVPTSALRRGLERAAIDRQVGETVLFALHMLGGRPEAVHPEAVGDALEALRKVGLDQDARAIAVTTAIGQGL